MRLVKRELLWAQAVVDFFASVASLDVVIEDKFENIDAIANVDSTSTFTVLLWPSSFMRVASVCPRGLPFLPTLSGAEGAPDGASRLARVRLAEEDGEAPSDLPDKRLLVAEGVFPSPSPNVAVCSEACESEHDGPEMPSRVDSVGVGVGGAASSPFLLLGGGGGNMSL